jgi:glycosyl hydrolase family 76
MYELIGWTPGAGGGSWNTDGRNEVRWNYNSGLWGGPELSHWWQSALVLRAVVRYLEHTGTVGGIYQTLLERSYSLEVHHPIAIASDYFVNMYGDDTLWWGLAWLEAAKYEQRYLHNLGEAKTFLWTAEHDARHVMRFKKSCGGFVWEVGYPSNTATNGEFIALAAGLSALRSAPGPLHDSVRAEQWSRAARSDLNWLEHSGLVNMQTGRVSDRLTHSCHVVGGPLTYTEGQTAEALVQMGNALHQPSYYAQAGRFLRFITTARLSRMDSPTGILQEQCESLPSACEPARDARSGIAGTPDENFLDQLVYKGIVAQAIDDYVRATGSPRYRSYLRRQATAIVYYAIADGRGRPANCTSPATCQFAFRWGSPVNPARPPKLTAATQMSALTALTGALPGGG